MSEPERSEAVLSVFDYNPDLYDFRSWACAALRVSDLSAVHHQGVYDPSRPNDRRTRARWNGMLVGKLPQLVEIMGRFIERELPRFFVGAPEVRHPPMLRVHPPGCESISPDHRDSEYGLVLGAINVWIPLTRVWGANTLWVESAPERGDFRPIELDYGQALLFDAVQLTHGSRTNTTEVTRVSFDFRCHGRLRPSAISGD